MEHPYQYKCLASMMRKALLLAIVGGSAVIAGAQSVGTVTQTTSLGLRDNSANLVPQSYTATFNSTGGYWQGPSALFQAAGQTVTVTINMYCSIPSSGIPVGMSGTASGSASIVSGSGPYTTGAGGLVTATFKLKMAGFVDQGTLTITGSPQAGSMPTFKVPYFTALHAPLNNVLIVKPAGNTPALDSNPVWYNLALGCTVAAGAATDAVVSQKVTSSVYNGYVVSQQTGTPYMVFDRTGTAHLTAPTNQFQLIRYLQGGIHFAWPASSFDYATETCLMQNALGLNNRVSTFLLNNPASASWAQATSGPPSSTTDWLYTYLDGNGVKHPLMTQPHNIVVYDPTGAYINPINYQVSDSVATYGASGIVDRVAINTYLGYVYTPGQSLSTVTVNNTGYPTYTVDLTNRG